MGPRQLYSAGPVRRLSVSGNQGATATFVPGIARAKGSDEGLSPGDFYENVQVAMRRSGGRSETLNPRPVRHYLLKGIVRCSHCGMPMWAQTYKNGQRYYREHTESRSLGICPAKGGSIPCEVADEQLGHIVTKLILPADWLYHALARLNLLLSRENVRVWCSAIVSVRPLCPDTVFRSTARLLSRAAGHPSV